MSEILLNEQQTAELLNLKISTLQGWRTRRKGPAYVAISRRAVRYKQSDIQKWIDEHMRNTGTPVDTEKAK